MSFGMIALLVLSLLTLFGLGQRVLDRLHLSDRTALFAMAAIFVGGLIPPIPIGRVRLGIGGCLVPVALCVWTLVRAGSGKERARALIGSVLGIKPVMHMDNEGLLKLVDKARGRKASIKRLISEVEKRAIDPKTQTMFISHGGCADEANAIAETLKRDLGVPEVIVNYVGPVVGAHSGPGTLALFCVGTER